MERAGAGVGAAEAGAGLGAAVVVGLGASVGVGAAVVVCVGGSVVVGGTVVSRGAGGGTGVGGGGVGAGVGAGDLQVAMHSPGDSKPFGSTLHWPVAESQLYMVGVGAGVGTGGVGLHQCVQKPRVVHPQHGLVAECTVLHVFPGAHFPGTGVGTGVAGGVGGVGGGVGIRYSLVTFFETLVPVTLASATHLGAPPKE
jgi:hypothetical protein